MAFPLGARDAIKDQLYRLNCNCFTPIYHTTGIPYGVIYIASTFFVKTY